MMSIIITMFIIFVNVFTIYGYNKHLTPGQWGSIRRVILHPDTPVEIIHKTHNVIYSHYESWAIHRAHIFRKTHPETCKHISQNELAIYALRGLIYAIEWCDFRELGNVPFSIYAVKWVDCELYDGMTELQPISNKRTHSK